MEIIEFNEISISYSCKKLEPGIQSSKDAYDLMLPGWADIDYTESFFIILLNRANNLLGACKISTGGLSGTVTDPKKIFQTALKANASSVILAHNHPSGNTKPSKSDLEITKKCAEAGKFLDLKVLDHVIVTRDGYFSFADEGMI